MLYLKYMPFRSAKNASRNMRELSAAEEYGFQTGIFSNDSSETLHQFMVNRLCIYDGTIPANAGMKKTRKIARIIKNYVY